MSQRDELKDVLFEQLADLEIFERLLRFDPARQKLFLCLATLVSRGKPLATELQNAYTMRYQKSSAKDARRRQDTTRKCTPSTLATLAEAELAKTCNDDKTIQQQADAIAQNDLQYELMTLEAIDFGLRLGSFLSEAGWLNESIAILSCIANRLKNMEQKTIYLDCLQRQVLSNLFITIYVLMQLLQTFTFGGSLEQFQVSRKNI